MIKLASRLASVEKDMNAEVVPAASDSPSIVNVVPEAKHALAESMVVSNHLVATDVGKDGRICSPIEACELLDRISVSANEVLRSLHVEISDGEISIVGIGL